MNQIETILTLIAQKHMFVDTLKTRKSDSADFHDVSVWAIKSALEAAFMAGVEMGTSCPKATESEIASP